MPTQKSLTIKSQTKDILLEKSKQHKFLAKQFMAKCLTAKSFRLKSFYDNGFDIKKFVEKIDLKTSNGNNLMAKAKVLKSLTNLIISVQIYWLSSLAKSFKAKFWL